MFRTHEDVIKQLNNTIINYKAALEKWKSVTFNCKKDGTPFQNLKKCFTGANYGFNSYDERHERPYLTISYRTDNAGYQESSLICIHQDGTFMAFDEIKTQIESRIAALKTDIKNCEEELNTVEDRLNEIDTAVSNMVDIIKRGKECCRYLNEYAEDKIKYAYIRM